MNIQNIKNETIHKLNRDEIGELGLLNYGVFTYKGNLKSRKNGFKTVKPCEWQVNFELDAYRVEFIQIEQVADEPEWAMRVFQKLDNQGYTTMVNVLWGCEFLK